MGRLLWFGLKLLRAELAGGEGNPGPDFGDGLIDQSEAAFAMAPLIGKRGGQLAAGGLQ
jgi:hypothetical protein